MKAHSEITYGPYWKGAAYKDFIEGSDDQHHYDVFQGLKGTIFLVFKE